MIYHEFFKLLLLLEEKEFEDEVITNPTFSGTSHHHWWRSAANWRLMTVRQGLHPLLNVLMGWSPLLIVEVRYQSFMNLSVLIRLLSL